MLHLPMPKSQKILKVALDKLATDQVKVRILTGGVGALSESDISLAAASQAIVVGFNVVLFLRLEILLDVMVLKLDTTL